MKLYCAAHCSTNVLTLLTASDCYIHYLCKASTSHYYVEATQNCDFKYQESLRLVTRRKSSFHSKAQSILLSTKHSVASIGRNRKPPFDCFDRILLAAHDFKLRISRFFFNYLELLLKSFRQTKAYNNFQRHTALIVTINGAELSFLSHKRINAKILSNCFIVQR